MNKQTKKTVASTLTGALLTSLSASLISAGLLAGITSALTTTPAHASGGQVVWVKDFQQGVRAAQQSRKWVFVVISAEWCGPCKMLHAKVLPDPTVEAFLNKNFVSVDLNADDPFPSSLLEKYQAPGIPCLMVFSPTGQFRGKFVGAPSSPEMFIRTVSALVK